MVGHELCTLLHTLAVFHLNQGQAQLAQIHLQHVVMKEPQRGSSWLHLAYADLLLNDLSHASESMRKFAALGQGNASHADQTLIDFLSPRVPF